MNQLLDLPDLLPQNDENQAVLAVRSAVIVDLAIMDKAAGDLDGARDG